MTQEFTIQEVAEVFYALGLAPLEWGEVEDVIVISESEPGDNHSDGPEEKASAYLVPVLNFTRISAIKHLLSPNVTKDDKKRAQYQEIIHRIPFYNGTTVNLLASDPNTEARGPDAIESLIVEIKDTTGTVHRIKVLDETIRSQISKQRGVAGMILTAVNYMLLPPISHEISPSSHGIVQNLTNLQEGITETSARDARKEATAPDNIEGYWLDLRQLRGMKVDVEISSKQLPPTLETGDPPTEKLYITMDAGITAPSLCYIVPENLYQDFEWLKMSGPGVLWTKSSLNKIDFDFLSDIDSKDPDAYAKNLTEFPASMSAIAESFYQSGSQLAVLSKWEREQLGACACYAANLTSFSVRKRLDPLQQQQRARENSRKTD